MRDQPSHAAMLLRTGCNLNTSLPVSHTGFSIDLTAPAVVPVQPAPMDISYSYSKTLDQHVQDLRDEQARLERPAFGLHWFRGIGLREAPYMSTECPESYARLVAITAELLPERLVAYETQHRLFLLNRLDYPS